MNKQKELRKEKLLVIFCKAFGTRHNFKRIKRMLNVYLTVVNKRKLN